MLQYVSFSAFGLVLGLFIRGHHLKTEHEVTEVGLDNLAERKKKKNDGSAENTSGPSTHNG